MGTETVASIIEEVKEAMCADYCRYPRYWNPHVEGMELDESAVCEMCPMNRLG